MFFFFNDTAPTEISTLPYTTLFRSASVRIAAAPRRSPQRDSRKSRSREEATAAPVREFRRGGRPPRSPRKRRRSPSLRTDRKSTPLKSEPRSKSYGGFFCSKKKPES